MRYFHRFYPSILLRNSNLINSFDDRAEHRLLTGSEAVLLDAAMQTDKMEGKWTIINPNQSIVDVSDLARLAISIAANARGR